MEQKELTLQIAAIGYYYKFFKYIVVEIFKVKFLLD